MWMHKGVVLKRVRHLLEEIWYFLNWCSFTFIALFLILVYFSYHTLLKYVLKIRAEIHTLFLIHKIIWEVSGMILYVISNPKFLWPSYTNLCTKYRTTNTTFPSFNMTTLFHLCMTACLAFRTMRFSTFLILWDSTIRFFFSFMVIFL